MKKRVIFVCTHNSNRSQIAEALLKKIYGEHYEVFSAGSHPTKVNNYAVKVLLEDGIDISKNEAKDISNFIGQDFDYVVTLCDSAKEECPYIPKAKKYLHQSFYDPTNFVGSEEEKIEKFRILKNEIESFIKQTFAV
ncbi:MAG: arsenate reductase ArsC [Bacteroidales bacterium]